MKRGILIICIIYAFVSSITAQVKDNKNSLPAYAIKTNALYWATTTPNLGFEIGLSVGGIKMLGLKDHRYQGNLYGAGVSYGYHWILNKRLSIEATIGVGYAYLDYDKYPCGKCGTKLKDGHKNYFGPTKAGVSLIYILK